MEYQIISCHKTGELKPGEVVAELNDKYFAKYVASMAMQFYKNSLFYVYDKRGEQEGCPDLDR